MTKMKISEDIEKISIYYQNDYWVPFVTRNMSFWHSCLDRSGSLKKCRYYLVKPKYTLSLSIDGGKLTTAFNADKLNKPHSHSVIALASSKKYFRLTELIHHSGEQLIEISKILYKKPSQASYLKYIEKYELMAPTLSLMTYIGRLGQEKLRQAIKKQCPHADTAELDEIQSVVSYPDRLTPMSESQLSLMKIADIIQKKKIKKWLTSENINKLLIAHRLRFAHLPVNFNEEPWSEKDINKQLSECLKLPAGKERRRIIQNHRHKIKQRNRMIKRLSGSSLRHWALVTQSATELNEYRKQVFCQASLGHRRLFRDLAKKYRLSSWQKLYLLTPEEIDRLAFFGDKSALKYIKQRRVAGVIYDQARKPYYRVLSDNVVKKWVKYLPKTKSMMLKANSVSGTSANKGKVSGRVKVVFSSNDFHKFKAGDILISPMTSVDFIPIMEKAAAFVTDEGGITSHASIVSRELNKPCIIGTKIATQIFKDGDRIEVDANRGIVNKL